MIETQHKTLKEYVNILLDSKENLLVVNGHAGIGKTYSINEVLKSRELVNGKNYHYISGYITPKQLFSVLSSCRTMDNPKLFWFDDIEGIMSNKISVSLLKSALWENNGKRVVTYQTSRPDGEPSFDFDGKVIIVLNNLKQQTALGTSLLDRGINYDMNINREELCHYIETILLDKIGLDIDKSERYSIWEKVKRFSDHPRFSIRCLHRAFSFYRYRDGDYGWYDLWRHTMQ